MYSVLSNFHQENGFACTHNQIRILTKAKLTCHLNSWLWRDRGTFVFGADATGTGTGSVFSQMEPGERGSLSQKVWEKLPGGARASTIYNI